ncbi:MAG: MBL fold metallo-hydrolase [Lachnospiraceae bacterium]|nr:MBL fold metallo-hydrolase [Lachnospiraceae bacterium]
MKLLYFSVGDFATNCYIYYQEESKEALIIDPGDEAGVIRARVDYYGLKPVAILLTHGHYDHIGAVKQLQEFFGCPVCAQKAEEELLLSPEKNLSQMFGHSMILEADTFLEDRLETEQAGCTLTVLHTPGHTGGSCCYYDRENGILFSGDTLFQYSYGRVDFPTGDMAKMQQSIAMLLGELPPKTKVYPGHGASTTIERERRYNPLSPYTAE